MRTGSTSVAGSDGTRLADLRLPRYWLVSVGAALVLARRRQNQELAGAVEGVEEIATLIGERWRETDRREAELLALQARVVRLTWAMLLLTVAVLGVTIWAVLAG